MKLNRLGRSEIEVTDICLGSMTWASQNTEAEAHEQQFLMEFALHGLAEYSFLSKQLVDSGLQFRTVRLSREDSMFGCPKKVLRA